jgi:hypothetical protein
VTNKYKSTRTILIVLLLLVGVSYNASAGRKAEVVIVLNDNGKKHLTEYTNMLDSLNKEIAAELPKIDAQKKETYLKARSEYNSLSAPGEDAPLKALKAYQVAKVKVGENSLATTKALLKDLDAFLANDKLDKKLIKATILSHGTPKGLAEFAQQSDKHKALLDQLLSNEELMKQMLLANGANGGEYGEAMQIYTAILESSEHARKPGILQRLALGTALHMPWIHAKQGSPCIQKNEKCINSKDKMCSHNQVMGNKAIPSLVYDAQRNIDQIARYLHYEKAYFDKELDPAFKDMNVWECRFIINSEYSNKDLAWIRMTMRNFRPDIITWEDEKWRYSRFIKSDVPYTSTVHDRSLGTPAQEQVCLGGICGRRAFLGRLTTRAFGIPTRRSRQTGHAAMCRWTSTGWKINLGAWWSSGSAGPQGGLDFYLDSRAREFSEEYMQVLRAQWIGNALGQEDIHMLNRSYGKNGGFWDGLAFHMKEVIAEKMEQDEADAKLANLSAKEGQTLGESDAVLNEAEIKAIVIPEDDSRVIIAKDGTITIPAVACTSPKNNTDKVVFQNSFGGGMQLHYQRIGNRPEILRYSFEAPAAGKYELSLNVCTVSQKYEVIARLNRRTLVNIMLPFTKGIWDRTESKVIELREGRNTIMFTFRAPNRGVSIKEFQLKPVK